MVAVICPLAFLSLRLTDLIIQKTGLQRHWETIEAVAEGHWDESMHFICCHFDEGEIFAIFFCDILTGLKTSLGEYHEKSNTTSHRNPIS